MTTKVKVEIVQKHMPIVIEVLREDGTVQYTQTLNIVGGSGFEDYVHSGQKLLVREMTTQEMHTAGLTT